MSSRYHNLLWIFLFLVFAIIWFSRNDGSEVASKKETKEKGEKHGAVRTYDNEGNLQTIVSYEHGIKEGVSSVFYRNGQVMLEMPYHGGRREGESRKYYEDGALYAVTPYASDEISGVRTTYFRNGKIKAQIPYFRSFPGLGLIEYDLDGEQKELPRIDLVQNGETWLFTINDCFKPIFYIGSLLNNQYLSPEPDFVSPLPASSDGAYMDVADLPDETFNVICKCTTRSGNPHITRLVLNH